jgi:hypothetical protein
MSNVIDFLERMGQDADMRHASAGDLLKMLEDAAVNFDSHAAIASRDEVALAAVLGAESKLCCMVYPVESVQ